MWKQWVCYEMHPLFKAKRLPNRLFYWTITAENQALTVPALLLRSNGYNRAALWGFCTMFKEVMLSPALE